jgi:hypothetical protein
MKIETFKDLKTLVQLCQKLGVTSIKADNVELQLGVKPYKPKPQRLEDPLANVGVPTPNIYDPIAQAKAAAAKATQALKDKIHTDELTEEQLLNWSVRQEPGHESPQ